MKIPIYNASQNLGSPKTYPVRREQVFDDPWLKAGRGSAAMLEDRYAEIETERDQIEVVQALGALGDAERLFIASEEARPVGDSAGSLDRGGNWYKSTIEGIAGKLRSRNAKDLFQLKSVSQRSHGLDRLAGDMAKKHNMQKKGEIEGMQANIYTRIGVGTTADQLDEDIRELHGKVEGYYKGVNSDAIKSSSKVALINAFLKDKALSDPEAVAGLLKRYDKDLSEQDAKAISDMAVKSLSGIEASELYDNIKSLHKDPSSALAAAYVLKATDASPGVVDAVRKMFKDEFATYNTYKTNYEKELQSKAENEALNLWVGNKFGELRNHVMKTMPDPGRVEHWLDKIDTAEDAVKDGKDNPYDKSDKQVKALVTSTIMTAPHTLTQESIWDLNGNGLSTKDATSLAKAWEDRSVKGSNPKEVEVANILKWYQKGMMFDSDVLENQQIHDRLLQDCFAWSASNPEGDVVEYMKTKINALEGYTWFNRRLDAFKGFFRGAPGTDDLPVKPVLPGDLEDIVGWGNPEPPAVRKAVTEDPTHKAKRILEEGLKKHNKEK